MVVNFAGLRCDDYRRGDGMDFGSSGQKASTKVTRRENQGRSLLLDYIPSSDEDAILPHTLLSIIVDVSNDYIITLYMQIIGNNFLPFWPMASFSLGHSRHSPVSCPVFAQCTIPLSVT